MRDRGCTGRPVQHVLVGRPQPTTRGVRRNLDTDTRIHHVVLTGMATAQACHLRNRLQRRCRVDVVPDCLGNLTAPADRAAIIVAGELGLSEPAVRAATRLRTECFVWQPIVLLLEDPHVPTVPEWSVHVRSMPPDITDLVQLLSAVSPVTHDRQLEIASASLLSLWDALLSLSRTCRAPATIGQEELSAALQHIEALSVANPATRTLEPLSELVLRGPALVRMPEVGPEGSARLKQLVVQAEEAVRAVRGAQRLHASVHHLNNLVRLEAWSSSRPWQLMREAHSVLAHFPGAVADRLSPGLSRNLVAIRKVLLEPLAQPPDHGPGDALAAAFDAASSALAETRHHIARLRAVHCGSGEVSIDRILVVEDEPCWREQIVALLKDMDLPTRVEQASNVEQAERCLHAEGCGVLLLLDLGLPLNSSDESDGKVALDGGLHLARTANSSGLAARVIVLTAAENYAEAVRMALRSGVEAWDYIQKGPFWEEQLRSRVRIALMPRPPRIPDVQVYRSTLGLVCVDGVEVLLDRKPYLLLEYLAERARRWCPVERMREDLSQPGRHDLTPPLTRDADSSGLETVGAHVTPYDLLTPARLQDLVYDVRRGISEAFAATGRRLDASALLAFQPEPPAYRLQARTEVCESPSSTLHAAAPASVLIIEDDPHWADAIVAAVRFLGFDTALARTLDEAKAAVLSRPPDLISLDLQIPRDEAELASGLASEANSVAFLEFLGSASPESRTAVLTAVAHMDGVMLDLLRKGIAVSDYVSKQWDRPLDRLVHSLWRLWMEGQRGTQIVGDTADVPLHRVQVHPEHSESFQVDGVEVRLAPQLAVVFSTLATSMNVPVDRELLKDALWPNPDDWPDDHDRALNTVVQRLRDAVSKATGAPATGSEVIRSRGGAYVLRGANP